MDINNEFLMNKFNGTIFIEWIYRRPHVCLAEYYRKITNIREANQLYRVTECKGIKKKTRMDLRIVSIHNVIPRRTLLLPTRITYIRVDHFSCPIFSQMFNF